MIKGKKDQRLTEKNERRKNTKTPHAGVVRNWYVGVVAG